MKSDIQIARETPLKKITEVASSIGISSDDLHTYGHYMAKVPVTLFDNEKIKKSNLILVTAITPTKAGIGKTTVSIGLALGLNRIGKKAIVALREPSLGPVFGMKGGAAGGGYSQVLPMENINLHFTGDFHAITSAHNTISALLDNYIYQSDSPKRLKEVVWKRVLDVNDRNLRYIVTGLNGATNGVTQESGFDITPASELMAILCLAENLEDLRRRIENITLAYTTEGEPFTVKDLGVAGAITVLLKDAVNPNLVQTTENTAAFVHGGPFANIAHGCNSVTATRLAKHLADYAVTEAGFGADLGAEKFCDIKCRLADLKPDAAVVVATVRALKYNGGVERANLGEENLDALAKGLPNLLKHISNLKNVFGLPVVVAINRFVSDSDAELAMIEKACAEHGVEVSLTEVWGKGGAGGADLAQKVVNAIENQPNNFKFAYDVELSIKDKIRAIAQKVYGAEDVDFSAEASAEIASLEKLGLDKMPVCMAKTQYSLSDNAKLLGCPKGFRITVRGITVSAGAGFIVALCGNMMKMPGLPKVPAAEKIDVDAYGVIHGLF